MGFISRAALTGGDFSISIVPSEGVCSELYYPLAETIPFWTVWIGKCLVALGVVCYAFLATINPRANP